MDSTTDVPIFLANRIVDSVFIGSYLAAEDEEFVFSNSIAYIVNCVAGEVRNRFAANGVHYISISWPQNESISIFDRKANVLEEIFNTIEKARQEDVSMLIHSQDGISRSVIVMAAFLIYRYHWRPQRALQFIATKRFNTNPKPALVRHLIQWSERLRAQRGEFRDIFSLNADLSALNLENDELLHRNSFLNAVQANPVSPKLVRRLSANVTRIAEAAEQGRLPTNVANRLRDVNSKTGLPRSLSVRWRDNLTVGQVSVLSLPDGNPSLVSALFRPPNPGYYSQLPVISCYRPVDTELQPARANSPEPPGGITPTNPRAAYQLENGVIPPQPSILIARYSQPSHSYPKGAIVIDPTDIDKLELDKSNIRQVERADAVRHSARPISSTNRSRRPSSQASVRNSDGVLVGRRSTSSLGEYSRSDGSVSNSNAKSTTVLGRSLITETDNDRSSRLSSSMSSMSISQTSQPLLSSTGPLRATTRSQRPSQQSILQRSSVRRKHHTTFRPPTPPRRVKYGQNNGEQENNSRYLSYNATKDENMAVSGSSYRPSSSSARLRTSSSSNEPWSRSLSSQPRRPSSAPRSSSAQDSYSFSNSYSSRLRSNSASRGSTTQSLIALSPYSTTSQPTRSRNSRERQKPWNSSSSVVARPVWR